MYRSDIRSMINFLQLNQNLKLNEWNRFILNDQVLDNLHNMFCDKTTHNGMKQKIHIISTTYNTDKKHILHSYFNYVIRNKLVKLTPEFMDMLERIVHTTNATVDDILYFISNSNIQII